MIARIVAFLFALVVPAAALDDASIPVKVPIPWGTSAPGGQITTPIPQPSQQGIAPGRASWTDGFPPLTFSPIAAGGIPPSGADFNGVFNQMSQWIRWYNAGAPIFHDPTFQTAIGGYPKGAIVAHATDVGCYWISEGNNNVSTPGQAGATWLNSCKAPRGRTFLTPTPGLENPPYRLFYVNASTGADANNCEAEVQVVGTLTGPCLTIQRAVDNVKQNYDSNCVQPWIYVAPGSYTGWSDYAPQTGCQPSLTGGGPMIVAGYRPGIACADTNVIVTMGPPPATAAVSYDGNATGVVLCMTLNAPSGTAIYATNGAIMEVGLLRFGTATTSMLADTNGTIIATSTLKWAQGAIQGLWAKEKGILKVVPGVSIQFDAGIGFSPYFIFAGDGGVVNFPVNSLSFVGAPIATTKCGVNYGGLVISGNPTGIPGTNACVVDAATYGLLR